MLRRFRIKNPTFSIPPPPPLKKLRGRGHSRCGDQRQGARNWSKGSLGGGTCVCKGLEAGVSLRHWEGGQTSPGIKPEGPDCRCWPRKGRAEAETESALQERWEETRRAHFPEARGFPSAFPECLLNACAWCQDFRDEGILFSGVLFPGMNRCAVSYLLSE